MAAFFHRLAAAAGSGHSRSAFRLPIGALAAASGGVSYLYYHSSSDSGVKAGIKAAAVATIATAIPTFASVRMLPWARANLNPTAQALIISTAAGMAYFIVAAKTILATARRNSFHQG